MGISTHILDTERGRPAVGVGVRLARQAGGAWVELQAARTDEDGRCKELLVGEVEVGVYRVRFETAEYFAGIGVDGFYPWVEIAFEVKRPGERFHVPLLLTAHGYGTYRGS